MHFDESAIAKKYARAFLRTFGNDVDDLLIESCSAISEFLKTNRYVYVLMCMPTMSHEAKKKSLEMVLNKYNAHKHLYELGSLLIDQGRIDGIITVFDAVQEEYYTMHSIELFTVISSHVLSLNQKQQLTIFVQQLAQQKIRVAYALDKKLIVGLRVQSNALLWERSIRKELQEISTYIAQKGMS